MYPRTLLPLSRASILVAARELTTGGLSGNRYADQILRRLSVGSVFHCKKSTPENNGVVEPSGETENKSTVSGKEENAVTQKENEVLNVIAGMKVEVSSKEKFYKKKLMTQAKMDSASKMFQLVAEKKQSESDQQVSPELATAASAVASTFPSQKQEVESELLRQLRLHKEMAESKRNEAHNISNLISGMLVKKSSDVRPTTNYYDGERDGTRKGYKRGLYSAKRLQIFPVPAKSSKQSAVPAQSPNLWDLELAKEIAAISEHPPRNGFEEMIQWTKEGKLWTFPINNEAGLDVENNVEFYEHIFLEKHLEDFPKEGPIRHFMELVVCGLSKNPYLTVQQKKDHIHWFRDYFQQKEDILRECEIYLN